VRQFTPRVRRVCAWLKMYFRPAALLCTWNEYRPLSLSLSLSLSIRRRSRHGRSIIGDVVDSISCYRRLAKYFWYRVRVSRLSRRVRSSRPAHVPTVVCASRAWRICCTRDADSSRQPTYLHTAVRCCPLRGDPFKHAVTDTSHVYL